MMRPSPLHVDEPGLVALFGHPVAHSLSRHFQSAAFAKLGLPWAYMPFDIEPSQLAAAFEAARVLGFRGLNITVPHKEPAARLCDQLAASATRSGACNTVVVQPGGICVGHDTDGVGFVRALQERGVGGVGRRLVLGILGAGGAARAVLASACALGIDEGWIAARRLERADSLAAEAAQWGLALRGVALGSALPPADLIVQATPLSLSSDRGGAVGKFQIWLRGALPAGGCWVDLAYATGLTPFLEVARLIDPLGTHLDGLAMLLHQGAAGFELWTGVAAPMEAMRAALERAAGRLL